MYLNLKPGTIGHPVQSSTCYIHLLNHEDKRITHFLPCMTCGTHAHRILFEKPEGKSLLGIAKHTCEDNIKMVFKETGWVRVDCIHLAQDRDKSMVNPGTQCGIIPRSTKPDLWVGICH
jgi:hypothetical protein